jgi:hypothetical protein
MLRSVTGVVLLMMALTLQLGCGPSGPDIARVQGTVTMDGKPVPNAIIMFVPVGGRPSVSETDANGKYVLEFSGGRKGAIPGMNRVEINTGRLAYEKDGKNYPAVKESVPAQYNRLTTLEFNVEAGKNNTADFALKSGGKIVEE